jgi:hypothetical protein
MQGDGKATEDRPAADERLVEDRAGRESVSWLDEVDAAAQRAAETQQGLPTGTPLPDAYIEGHFAGWVAAHENAARKAAHHTPTAGWL